jgi:hypothetical protein
MPLSKRNPFEEANAEGFQSEIPSWAKRDTHVSNDENGNSPFSLARDLEKDQERAEQESSMEADFQEELNDHEDPIQLQDPTPEPVTNGYPTMNTIPEARNANEAGIDPTAIGALFFSVVFPIAGVIMALIALSHYKHNRYTSGKWLAVVALITGVIMFLVTICVQLLIYTGGYSSMDSILYSTSASSAKATSLVA